MYLIHLHFSVIIYLSHVIIFYFLSYIDDHLFICISIFRYLNFFIQIIRVVLLFLPTLTDHSISYCI